MCLRIYERPRRSRYYSAGVGGCVCVYLRVGRAVDRVGWRASNCVPYILHPACTEFPSLTPKRAELGNTIHLSEIDGDAVSIVATYSAYLNRG